jgi:hypothetical protein
VIRKRVRKSRRLESWEGLKFELKRRRNLELWRKSGQGRKLIGLGNEQEKKELCLAEMSKLEDPDQ